MIKALPSLGKEISVVALFAKNSEEEINPYFSSFTLFERVNADVFCLFFTGTNDLNNKAWSMISSKWIASKEKVDHIFFPQLDSLNTGWIPSFLEYFIKQRKESKLEDLDPTKPIYHQVKASQGLDFKYKSPEDSKLLEFCRTLKIQAEEFIAEEPQIPSHFVPDWKRPVLIVTTGLPGVGKTSVVNLVLKKHFPRLDDFVEIDIDAYVEPLICERLALPQNSDNASWSEEKRGQFISNLYDEIWEQFEEDRLNLLKAGKNIITHVSGRNRCTINDFKELIVKAGAKHRIVNIAVSSPEELIQKRIEDRGRRTGRTMSRAFMRSCQIIPNNQHAFERVDAIPTIRIVNPWTPEQQEPASIVYISDENNPLWRIIAGEPSYWMPLDHNIIERLSPISRYLVEFVVFGTVMSAESAEMQRATEVLSLCDGNPSQEKLNGLSGLEIAFLTLLKAARL